MKAKRNRDPEATKAAIIDAAEEIFLRKGFGATAVSEIAKQAGITKSLIHHYFGSKEGLWKEVKTRRFMYYAEKQMALLQDVEPSVKLLRDALEIYFTYLQENPQLIRIMAWMFLEQEQEVCITTDRELIRAGIELMKQGQEQGLLRSDIDPRFILFTFIGICHHWFQDREHFISSFGTEGLPKDLDNAYMESMAKIFFEGILPK